MNTRIRVVIADDDKALADALSDTIKATDDLEVVGVANDTDSAISLAAAQKPDVVLMDFKMPGGGGVVATAAVLAQSPEVRVVGLSAHEGQDTALKMFEAGAVAYIVKGAPEGEILDAIRPAARGQLSMPAEMGVAAFRDLQHKLAELMETEKILRSSDEHVHALLDAAPDALIIVNSYGEISMVNAQALLLFGYAPGELIGQNVDVLVPSGVRPHHESLRAGFVLHPRRRPMGTGLQISGRKKDGTEFPADITLSPVETAPDLLVVAAVRDMTRSRDMVEVTRKSEQMFRSLLESAPDAMVVIDGRGTIQLVNSRTEQLFGYPRNQLLGHNVDELVPDSFRVGHAGHRSKFFLDPQARPMGQGLELAGRRRDGTEFPVDISLSPVSTDDGLLVIAAVRDVTDRKVAEWRLAQAQEVAEKRRLLTHLVQVQEEERRKIAADIHDDSIQAMTAASLRLQQLRKHMQSDVQKDLLGKLDEAVRESIVRLRRLMFDLRPPALDRSGLAAALRELLERLKTESGLDYTLDVRVTLEPVDDVRVELYRIAQEALINVRKHSRAGHVSVELQHVDQGFRIRIADDGTGFDVAGRADQAGHLGMTAMRERAQIAGGWWTVASEPGKGAEVNFWLPDAREKDDDAAAVRL